MPTGIVGLDEIIDGSLSRAGVAYDELRRENDSLRQRNAELVQRAVDAAQALQAQLIGRRIGDVSGTDAQSDAGARTFRELGYMRGQVVVKRTEGNRQIAYSSVSNVAPGLDLSVMRDITEGPRPKRHSGATKRSSARSSRRAPRSSRSRHPMARRAT
jgi:hypothetical protein